MTTPTDKSVGFSQHACVHYHYVTPRRPRPGPMPLLCGLSYALPKLALRVASPAKYRPPRTARPTRFYPVADSPPEPHTLSCHEPYGPQTSIHILPQRQSPPRDFLWSSDCHRGTTWNVTLTHARCVDRTVTSWRLSLLGGYRGDYRRGGLGGSWRVADHGGRETTPPRTGPHPLMILLLALLVAWPAHMRTATMFAPG